MNPAKLITWPARTYPDRIAVQCEGRRYTFLEFNRRINKLAHGLISLGLRRGDHVSLLMSNSIEQIESRFAIAKCGLTMIRLNARDAMETQRYILRHSETIAIFVGEEFKSGLKEIKKRLPRLKHYIALSAHDEDFVDYYTSSLKMIFYGTSPISPERLKKAIEIFGPIFRQNYGMAEAIMPLICLHPQDHVIQGSSVNMKRLRSVGRPALGVEVRVVDKKRREVAPGEIGEIIIRGEHMMKGYWKTKKETAKILKHGWLHTGDLATVDGEGYIYIMDRKKDMIISGGFNIYPKEIENLMYSHPDVKEVAVIGVPDDEWGESVKAFIVSHEGRTVDKEEITELCRNRLASYKKPNYIDIVKSLPKNAVGKIMKDILRKKEWEGYERMVH